MSPRQDHDDLHGRPAAKPQRGPWWEHPNARLLERYGLELSVATWHQVRALLPTLAHEVLDHRGMREGRLSHVPIAQPPQGTLWVPVVWEYGRRAGHRAPEVLIRTVYLGGYWTGVKFDQGTGTVR